VSAGVRLLALHLGRARRALVVRGLVLAVVRRRRFAAPRPAFRAPARSGRNRPGVERQAEREGQRRRAIELAVRAIDDLEADTIAAWLLVAIAWQMADGEKAGNCQHDRRRQGDHRCQSALSDWSSDAACDPPGEMLKGF
jgi:uncharacterized protein YqjF (DUF2071 family)